MSPLYPYAFALQTFIIAYLVFAEPLYGRFAYHRLQVTLETDPVARVRFYRGIILVEWFLVGLTALSLRLTDKEAGWLGLRPLTPERAEFLQGMGIAVLAGLVLVHLLTWFVQRVRRNYADQLARFDPLLPTGWREHLVYAVSAITAGICEEVLFRGLVLGYLGTWVPELLTWGAVAISAVIFGLAHLYQGWKGMIGTGLLGAVLGGIYLFTGSLWPSVVLHALIGLNAPLTAWSVRRGEARDTAKAA